MLGNARQATRALERFFASPFLLLRIPPNSITIFSLVPAVVAAGLCYYQEYLWALLAGIVAGGLDFVDGTVARVRHQITRFGGYLDSVVDRFVDFLLLFGLALGRNEFWTWIAFALCVLGSFGTSYAKARAYETVEVPKTAWVQLFERPERVLLLGIGVLAQGILDWQGIAFDAIFWTLVVFAAGSLWTTGQRILKVRTLLRSREEMETD